MFLPRDRVTRLHSLWDRFNEHRGSTFRVNGEGLQMSKTKTLPINYFKHTLGASRACMWRRTWGWPSEMYIVQLIARSVNLP